MTFLKVAGISIQEERSFALKEISFTQQPLQKIAIAGETGSGKSTLLQIIAGLVQPDQGEVFFENKKVIGPVDTLVPGHPGIAYLSQQFELPQFLRVEQVLTYANKLSADEANTLFRVCHIDYLLPRKTNQLSGGERQRIALAKLLLGAPKLLLLDEPFSNLDTGHKHILKKVIHDIGEKLGITLILISHDPLDTLSWADEILVMKEGALLQQGPPAQIYRQPVNEYVASLFGNYNLLPAAQFSFLTQEASLPSAKSNMLIRPEHFIITKNEKEGHPGEISQLTFYGSYDELELRLQEEKIKVKTDTRQFTKGEKVFISVLPENVWFL